MHNINNTKVRKTFISLQKFSQPERERERETGIRCEKWCTNKQQQNSIAAVVWNFAKHSKLDPISFYSALLCCSAIIAGYL